MVSGFVAEERRTVKHGAVSLQIRGTFFTITANSTEHNAKLEERENAGNLRNSVQREIWNLASA